MKDLNKGPKHAMVKEVKTEEIATVDGEEGFSTSR